MHYFLLHSRGLTYTGIAFLILGALLLLIGVLFAVGLYIAYRRLNGKSSSSSVSLKLLGLSISESLFLLSFARFAHRGTAECAEYWSSYHLVFCCSDNESIRHVLSSRVIIENGSMTRSVSLLLWYSSADKNKFHLSMWKSKKSWTFLCQPSKTNPMSLHPQ